MDNNKHIWETGFLIVLLTASLSGVVYSSQSGAVPTAIVLSVFLVVLVMLHISRLHERIEQKNRFLRHLVETHVLTQYVVDDVLERYEQACQKGNGKINMFDQARLFNLKTNFKDMGFSINNERRTKS